jgi:NTP pyrophosphatase (non-canonical NTP hydrolase)
MQWKNGESLSEDLRAKSNEVGEELADILYWLLLIAHDLKIDLSSAFARKMLVNAQKYPIESSRGTSQKYTHI